ncbi:uncharacterized protein LOC135105224 isoform X1 [Scylla paramamosain]|uniref:uncharacterized protein LOC135105224 isoform X1 n=1 Tax=Scylla paramamosain TaxID=85552 RepID=UPI003083E35B
MASVKNGIQRVTHKLESLDPRNYQKHNQQYLLWFCIAVMADATSGFQIPAVRDTYTWKGETSDATAYTIVLFPTPLGGFRAVVGDGGRRLGLRACVGGGGAFHLVDATRLPGDSLHEGSGTVVGGTECGRHLRKSTHWRDAAAGGGRVQVDYLLNAPYQ